MHRLLEEQGDEIERATGHRPRVVRALVRDVEKQRGFAAAPGVLTTDPADILDDASIRVVAEVMGGVEPAGDHVLGLLRSGRSVVTANKQLVARRGAELFAAASEHGVQLRFEASVCAAIPVIKVLRESLVVTNVHRVLGIVNGTTNFILSAMEEGRTYGDALAEAQRLGYAEADPTDDVGGIDAAAKTAILATVAFGTRVPIEWVAVEGIEGVTDEHVAAARALDMRVKLLGRATLVGDRVDVRVGPAFVDAHHPLAAVEGAFNAVMLQGDAIREITLEGPGAGGIETASAVVADMVSVIGTTGTGFLQNDPVWRDLSRLGARRSRLELVPAPRGRGPRRRARAHRAGVRDAPGVRRPARPASWRRRGRPPRDHARGVRRQRGRCAGRDPGAARVEGRGERAARGLRPRRRRARLGVIGRSEAITPRLDP